MPFVLCLLGCGAEPADIIADGISLAIPRDFLGDLCTPTMTHEESPVHLSRARITKFLNKVKSKTAKMLILWLEQLKVYGKRDTNFNFTMTEEDTKTLKDELKQNHEEVFNCVQLLERLQKKGKIS